jgi:6-phosphogluconolactonase
MTFGASLMLSYSLNHFPDADTLAAAVAAKWLGLLPNHSDGPYLAALSGGRVAHQFFSSIAASSRSQPNLLKSVHFFWADERCVPPGDPESNFRTAKELLFDPIQFPPERIHRIRGEISPESAAAGAEQELRAVALRAKSGTPELNIIFLGMGEDGHVASLFPGEDVAQKNLPAIYRPVVASKPPPNRITLGYSTIAAAREVWILASGKGKEAALRASLTPEGTTPLAQVLRAHRGCSIFTDIPLPA